MFVSLLLALPSLAAQEGAAELALRGLDPVALCRGNEVEARADLRATHGRYTYGFASEENRAAFLGEPERWGIQWGGGCARMGPLSGVGSPERWAVHAGRIYIFASDGCRSGFLEAPGRFVVEPEEAPPPSDEALEAGRAWIERAVAAHGGADAIDTLGSLRMVFERETSGWKQQLEQRVASDGSIVRRSRWTPPEPDGEASETIWATGEDAYVDEGEGRIPMTCPAQRADLTRFAQREPISLLWQRHGDDFTAVYAGAGNLASTPVESVQVRCAGLTSTLHLEPGSGRILGITWRGRPNDGVTRDVVETFTEWREVDGVSIPAGRTAVVDGKADETLGIRWQTIEPAG